MADTPFKKFLKWTGIAFLVFFLLSAPTDAAGTVRSAFAGIENAANQVAMFVKSI